MAAVSATQIASEASAGVRAAQDALEQQAARLTATGDPTGIVVSAYAAAVGAQHRLTVDANLKSAALHAGVEKLIKEGRKPWSRDEMRELVDQLDETLLHRWTVFNRAGIAIGVVVALAFGLACTVGGWSWRGAPPALTCQDQPDGSRVCYVFTRPPTQQPPATTAPRGHQ
jgi:hypothetical protein